MPLPANLATIFTRLPSQALLAVAKEIQQRVLTNSSLMSLKDKTEYVTVADEALQWMILDYFAQSDLAGTYRIHSEETIPPQQQVDVSQASWELIIDPLDGTGAFCQQRETWGVMVGARDLAGKLIYSWNLISTGDIYSTTSAATQPLTARTQLERVDVYNYGVNQKQYFPKQTSYPAAVWTGWQLYQGQLDGLVWLPSAVGKKTYPDYDLIFLGALKTQGWQVYQEEVVGEVSKVAVARNQTNLEKLIAINV